MKIQIRPRGVRLTKTQCMRLERDLDLALARFGDRIDRVIVKISKAEVEGLKLCEIELRLKPRILKVEDSDTDVALAVKHATQRMARSVSRAIEAEQLVRR
jgi:ribosome-associated translation inhibitor RaiA